MKDSLVVIGGCVVAVGLLAAVIFGGLALGGLLGWGIASLLTLVFDFDWQTGKAIGVVGGALSVLVGVKSTPK